MIRVEDLFTKHAIKYSHTYYQLKIILS